MKGFRYEQGTPVKRRKPLSRAWCMKLAAGIMVGSVGLVGGDASRGHSMHQGAGDVLTAAAFDEQRLADGLFRGAGGQVALLGLLQLVGALEAEDLGERRDGGLDRVQALAGE